LVGIFGEGEDKPSTVLVLVVGNKPKQKQNASSLKVKGLDTVYMFTPLSSVRVLDHVTLWICTHK